MKLSIFSYNYHPEPTGIPAYNTSMAQWLVRHAQWAVVVHTGMPHYPWWKLHPDYVGRDFRNGRANEVIEGVTVRRVPHYIPTAPVTGTKRILLDATWIWSTLWDSLRVKNRPDAILLIAPPFLGSFLGVILRLKWRCPVIYHVQDLQIDAALDLRMINPLLGKILLWTERIFLRQMDLVTTISGAMKRRLESKTRLKREVVLFPNWTDTSHVRPIHGPNPYRAEWGIGDDHVVILYSGNLGRKQGLEFLLEAFALLPRLHHVHFVIAGEGPERDALHQKSIELGLEGRIRFISLAPIERIAEFLSAGDIHCIPQRRAAADLVLPSKLTNILAAGRAFIATADANTDLAESVMRSGGGLVVEPENPSALADGLHDLIMDADLRRDMGLKGRQYAVEFLAIDRILQRFIGSVERLCGVSLPDRSSDLCPSAVTRTTRQVEGPASAPTGFTHA